MLLLKDRSVVIHSSSDLVCVNWSRRAGNEDIAAIGQYSRAEVSDHEIAKSKTFDDDIESMSRAVDYFLLHLRFNGGIGRVPTVESESCRYLCP